MVDADPREAAELAYQAALAALHDARSDLADVAAARRRLAYDRSGLDAADGHAREQALDARFADLASRTEALRERAAAARARVRRLGEDASEPAEVPRDDVLRGFEQPPHPEQAS